MYISPCQFSDAKVSENLLDKCDTIGWWFAPSWFKVITDNAIFSTAKLRCLDTFNWHYTDLKINLPMESLHLFVLPIWQAAFRAKKVKSQAFLSHVGAFSFSIFFILCEFSLQLNVLMMACECLSMVYVCASVVHIYKLNLPSAL